MVVMTCIGACLEPRVGKGQWVQSPRPGVPCPQPVPDRQAGPHISGQPLEATGLTLTEGLSSSSPASPPPLLSPLVTLQALGSLPCRIVEPSHIKTVLALRSSNPA